MWSFVPTTTGNSSVRSFQSFSRVSLFATPGTAVCHASLSITNSWSLLKLMSIELVMQSNHLILCRPLLLPPSIFPSIRSFPVTQFYGSGGHSIGVSASVLPVNIQDWFPLGWTGWTSLQSKELPWEDSPIVFSIPHFKSINSLVLSFLCSPILTSIHDYWKNNCFDQMNICWQSNASAS